MPTTITLKETPPPAKHTQFPALYKNVHHPKLIILFFNKTTGLVIRGGDTEHSDGKLSHKWINCDDSSEWVKIGGEVVIKCEA